MHRPLASGGNAVRCRLAGRHPGFAASLPGTSDRRRQRDCPAWHHQRGEQPDPVRAAFPGIVVGLKDSSGDWSNTRAVIEAFPGFAVFPANEAHLSDAIPLGVAGCISATANVNARGIADLIDALRGGATAGPLQAEATRLRMTLTACPLIPGIKALLAGKYDAPGWARVRPPLTPMDAGAARSLAERLAPQMAAP